MSPGPAPRAPREPTAPPTTGSIRRIEYNPGVRSRVREDGCRARKSRTRQGRRGHGVRGGPERLCGRELVPQQATFAPSRRPAHSPKLFEQGIPPLAAPTESPSTSSTRASGRPAESTHRTPLLGGQTLPAMALVCCAISSSLVPGIPALPTRPSTRRSGLGEQPTNPLGPGTNLPTNFRRGTLGQDRQQSRRAPVQQPRWQQRERVHVGLASAQAPVHARRRAV